MRRCGRGTRTSGHSLENQDVSHCRPPEAKVCQRQLQKKQISTDQHENDVWGSLQVLVDGTATSWEENNIASKCLKSTMGRQGMTGTNRNSKWYGLCGWRGGRIIFRTSGRLIRIKRRSILLMSRVYSFSVDTRGLEPLDPSRNDRGGWLYALAGRPSVVRYIGRFLRGMETADLGGWQRWASPCGARGTWFERERARRAEMPRCTISRFSRGGELVQLALLCCQGACPAASLQCNTHTPGRPFSFPSPGTGAPAGGCAVCSTGRARGGGLGVLQNSHQRIVMP